MHPVQAAPRQSALAFIARCFCLRCTPCRQRRGKGDCYNWWLANCDDAPRAGSAEAKVCKVAPRTGCVGCTPCRQRRGKGLIRTQHHLLMEMHPMQAAPRQRPWCSTHHMASADAPRAGSAEAKVLAVHVDHAIHDAPRAGSAEAKASPMGGGQRQQGCTPCRQRTAK